MKAMLSNRCGFGMLLGGLLVLSLSPKSLAQAQNSLTLYDEAKANGHNGYYRKNFSAVTERDYATITELAKASDLIIIGTPVLEKAVLSSDGMSISTETSFAIKAVFKGIYPLRQSIVVGVPGGAHKYQDGLTVALSSISYRPPTMPNTYAMFLRDTASGWILVGGSQGQFSLDSAGHVASSDLRRASALHKNYTGYPLAQFITTLRSAK